MPDIFEEAKLLESEPLKLFQNEERLIEILDSIAKSLWTIATVMKTKQTKGNITGEIQYDIVQM